jgi:hypothetical protein
MRSILLTGSLALLVSAALPRLVWAAPVPVACPAAQDLPALSGDWEALAAAHVPAGVAPSHQRLRLQVAADGRVRGQRDWAALQTGAQAPQGRARDGRPAFQDVQPLLGWIDPRSCRVLLVETEDAGRVEGWLRQHQGEPVLDLEVSQSGAGAVVVLARFQRPAALQLR